MATKKKPKLVPPDYDRCQAESLPGSFMTFGPRSWERCTNKPVWIATEKKPREDGLRGSMSLCQPCRVIFDEHPDRGTIPATFERIVPKRMRDWIGLHVRTTRKIERGDGKVVRKGTVLVVSTTWRGRLYLQTADAKVFEAEQECGFYRCRENAVRRKERHVHGGTRVVGQVRPGDSIELAYEGRGS